MAVGPSRGPLWVVFDPNVLVSAAISAGTSRRAVDLAAAGAFRMTTCPRLVDELHRVLQREKFLKWRTREQLNRFEAEIALIADEQPDPSDTPGVTRDPGDDYLVALAREARADRICSGDHDFADVSEPRVVTPGELVREILSPIKGT